MEIIPSFSMIYRLRFEGNLENNESRITEFV